MTSEPGATASKPRRIRAFTPPEWMGPAQRKQFRAILLQRIDAKDTPSDAEIDRIADYIASRYRIETLRQLLHQDEGEWLRGNKFKDVKARILQASRQLDAAEKQSHQLAADLGLI